MALAERKWLDSELKPVLCLLLFSEKTVGEERRWEGRGTGDGTEEGK